MQIVRVRGVRIDEILTYEECMKAEQLADAKLICEQIIKPKIREISRMVEQECDPMTIALIIEDAIARSLH